MRRTLELLEAHMGATITARFLGSCPICGGSIKAGEKISVVDKVWMHQQCAKDVVSGKKSLPAKGQGVQASGTKFRPKSGASSKRKATDKQIRYAMSLIRRLGKWGWHDSDYGQAGGPPPSAAELEQWTSAEVSALINSLKDEF